MKMFIQYKLYSEGKEVKTCFTRTKDGIDSTMERIKEFVKEHDDPITWWSETMNYECSGCWEFKPYYLMRLVPDGFNMLLAYCGKCYEEEFETLSKIIKENS